MDTDKIVGVYFINLAESCGYDPIDDRALRLCVSNANPKKFRA